MIDEDPSRLSDVRRSFSYSLYGVTVRSHWKLPFAENAESGPRDVDLIARSKSFFDDVGQKTLGPPNENIWFEHATLADGSALLRWLGVFEFLVSSDGRTIFGKVLDDVPPESYQVYLIGGALGFSLLKLQFDPLHATAVSVNGKAIGFLGKSGFGKSTLGGAFLQAGYPLVTDDLFVLKQDGNDFSVYPGPQRIKLLPEAGTHLFGKQITGVPMNLVTRKLILPLTSQQSAQAPVPLKILYALNRPPAVPRGDNVIVRRISRRRALLALLKNSYNDWFSEPARLGFQLHLYTQIACSISVRLLSYPRRLDLLPAVRDAILKDVQTT